MKVILTSKKNAEWSNQRRQYVEIKIALFKGGGKVTWGGNHLPCNWGPGTSFCFWFQRNGESGGASLHGGNAHYCCDIAHASKTIAKLW